MSQVVIHCPTTNKDIPTGIDLDKETWDSTPIAQAATQCVWCGQLHVWSKLEARLDVLDESSEEQTDDEPTEQLDKAPVVHLQSQAEEPSAEQLDEQSDEEPEKQLVS